LSSPVGDPGAVRLPLDQHRAEPSSWPRHGDADLRLPRLAARGAASTHARAQISRCCASTTSSSSPASTRPRRHRRLRQPARQRLPAAHVRRRSRHVVRQGPGSTATGDIFKHANFAGIASTAACWRWRRRPAVEVLHAATHSRSPSTTRCSRCCSRSVQEILDSAGSASSSRATPALVGFKIVTNVADEIGTAEVAAERVQIVDPGFEFEARRGVTTQNPLLLPPYGLEMEREIHYGRLEAARIRRSTGSTASRSTPPTPGWASVAAARRLRPARACASWGPRRRALGARHPHPQRSACCSRWSRIVRAGSPVGSERSWSSGEALVAEISCATCYIRRAYITRGRKRDEQGPPAGPRQRRARRRRIAAALASRLERKLHLGSITRGSRLLEALRERPQRSRWPASRTLLGLPAQPLTRLPDGSMAAAGIGCHGMALSMPSGATMGITHMGARARSGSAWRRSRTCRNIFQHRRRRHVLSFRLLAIRQAIAADEHHVQEHLQTPPSR